VVGAADEAFGERPVAFVVADAGHDAQVLQRDLPGLCEARLGRIKSPDRYCFVQQLPRSPTGKLLRRELRERLRDDRQPAPG
jgi:long-chain acyl-CoA synthetase